MNENDHAREFRSIRLRDLVELLSNLEATGDEMVWPSPATGDLVVEEGNGEIMYYVSLGTRQVIDWRLG